MAPRRRRGLLIIRFLSTGHDIDRAVDRLDAALRRAGATPLAAPSDGDVEALREIGEAIAPWCLPADLARLWSRVDFSQDGFVVSAWCMPAICEPRAALLSHRLVLETGNGLLYGPPLLFPLAVDKETRWSVELVGEETPGGIVFSHDDAIRVEYASVTDIVEVLAELVENGSFERAAEGRLLMAADGERHARETRLRGLTLPIEITNEPTGWPAHWLRAAGLDQADRTPLGSTHTIAEIAAAGGPVAGRIAGRVVGLAGSIDGSLVLLDDGTGTLEVWCPASATRWGLVHGRRFELAVRVAPTEIPAAVATAVRPLA